MAKAVLQEPRPGERLSRARQRLKLIDACITALHQHGPSRTTIDKVVSIADMSPGIVNFYFETKAALLVAALEHLAVEFETRVLEPLAALRDRPLVALDRLIELYLDPDLASARKVSVWYSFWGESSSRREYFEICGKRDVAFAGLVQEIVAREIDATGLSHLDADAIALGLIGCLEMMWQDIAFQEEADVDRAAAKRRCRAYLRSVFSGHAAPQARRSDRVAMAASESGHVLEPELAMFRRSWQFACSTADVMQIGDYVAWSSAVGRVLIVRNADGAVGGFVNTCLHRPHALVAGESGCLPKDIVCAADGAVYGLDGARRIGGKLHVLAVKIENCAIFVGHEAQIEDVAPRISLAGLCSVGHCEIWDVAADWKLVMEHWADTYIDTSMRSFGAGSLRMHEEAPGSVTRSFAIGGLDGGAFKRLYASLAEAASDVERRLIWPNLFVETRPDGVTIRQVLPLGLGHSRIRVRRYQVAPADRVFRSMFFLATRIARVWEGEDVRIIESTQMGMSFRGCAEGESGPGLAAFVAWLGFDGLQSFGQEGHGRAIR